MQKFSVIGVEMVIKLFEACTKKEEERNVLEFAAQVDVRGQNGEKTAIWCWY